MLRRRFLNFCARISELLLLFSFRNLICWFVLRQGSELLDDLLFGLRDGHLNLLQLLGFLLFPVLCFHFLDDLLGQGLVVWVRFVGLGEFLEEIFEAFLRLAVLGFQEWLGW